MSTPDPRRRLLPTLPIGTWIGVLGTAFLALLGLVSTGFWGMLLMVSLVVLATAAYGFAFRRATWLRLPRKRSSAAIGAGVAFALLIGSSSAYGAAHPVTAAPVVAVATPTAHSSQTPASTATATATRTPTPTPTPTPVVTTTTVTETSSVPFTSKTVNDAAVPQGTTSVTTVGQEGVVTKTYEVTSTDGVETARKLLSEEITTPPVTQVTTVGTYVAPPPAPAAQPSCTNGSYVNSAGNSVCRPAAADSAPPGATAKCGDGTYSFSQSRRGTCSSHGGVAAWL